MFNDVNSFVLWIESLKKASFEYSLDRIRMLDEIYGFPSKGMKYIHVAGTNGKGSVTTALKNILYKKGYNVGLYSSPYVIKFNERLSYNNRFISDEELLEIGNILYSKFFEIEKKMPLPTFFELMTIGAFIYFNKMNVDLCILEVGLGGTLDATNIITPLVSVITSISYDHCDVLGDTLEVILDNKLGIVKKGVPFVGISNNTLLDKYYQKASEMNSEFIYVDKENIKNVKIENFNTLFTYKNKNYKTSLIGVHQAENMSLVIETVNVLNKYYSIGITDEEVINGISDTYITARMQVVMKEPLVLVDGAHNPDGVKRLTDNLKLLKGIKKLVSVVAISKNKDKEEMLKDIISVSDELVVSSYSYKRSTSLEELEKIAKSVKGCNDIKISHLENIEEFIKSLDKEKIYVFSGSLYFAGDVLGIFNK